MAMFSVSMRIFCKDFSSIRIVGTFFSVAITTPFLAANSGLNTCTSGRAETKWANNVR